MAEGGTLMSLFKSEAGEREVLGYYRTLLEQWPVENEQIEIETPFGSTFVLHSGVKNRPVLVLLHGTGTNSAAWMGDVKKYGEYFNVYCIDIPGEPGLSCQERFNLDPKKFNRWLSFVFESLSIRSAHIIGQSLGGWIGLNLAADSKEKVDSVTLISPGGICNPRLSYFLKFFLFSLLGNYGRNKIKKMVGDDMELSAEAEKFLFMTFKHFKFRTEAPVLLTDEELRSIDVPVYYTAGENDPLLDTHKTAERLRKFLPSVKVEIENGGHIILDQTEKIYTFISRVNA